MTPKEFRSIRLSAGLTQDSCSELLGHGTRSMTEWENGRRLIPAGVARLMRLIAMGYRPLVIIANDAERSGVYRQVRPKLTPCTTTIYGQSWDSSGVRWEDLDWDYAEWRETSPTIDGDAPDPHWRVPHRTDGTFHRVRMKS